MTDDNANPRPGSAAPVTIFARSCRPGSSTTFVRATEPEQADLAEVLADIARQFEAETIPRRRLAEIASRMLTTQPETINADSRRSSASDLAK
jgi:hypothetical protein